LADPDICGSDWVVHAARVFEPPITSFSNVHPGNLIGDQAREAFADGYDATTDFSLNVDYARSQSAEIICVSPIVQWRRILALQRKTAITGQTISVIRQHPVGRTTFSTLTDFVARLVGSRMSIGTDARKLGLEWRVSLRDSAGALSENQTHRASRTYSSTPIYRVDWAAVF
jgi:hypothetical protein